MRSKNPKMYHLFHEIVWALHNVGSKRQAKEKKDAKMGKLTRTYKQLAALAQKVYI
jgi:hypothetical protein